MYMVLTTKVRKLAPWTITDRMISFCPWLKEELRVNNRLISIGQLGPKFESYVIMVGNLAGIRKKVVDEHSLEWMTTEAAHIYTKV